MNIASADAHGRWGLCAYIMRAFPLATAGGSDLTIFSLAAAVAMGTREDESVSKQRAMGRESRVQLSARKTR